MRMTRLRICFCFLLWASVSFAEERIVRMASRTFPDPLVWDSNYTACFVASDGRVYVGLNHHGAGGTVAVYDPATDSMTTLGDMNRLVGQTNVWVEPQAKVHAQIGEGADGKIYFGTHLSAFYSFAKFTSGEAYPGGHWMVYDPETGGVRDLDVAYRKENKEIKEEHRSVLLAMLPELTWSEEVPEGYNIDESGLIRKTDYVPLENVQYK